MGSLGAQEMVLIFILALVLFGPKKLPEIGRTLGKAITEFRRASTELKATFEREMSTLEQETQSLKEVTSQYQYDAYNYDYSSYEPQYSCEDASVPASSPSTESASAPQGAESIAAGTPEGAIAYGSATENEYQQYGESEPQAGGAEETVGAAVPDAGEEDHLRLEREPFGSEATTTPAEHKA